MHAELHPEATAEFIEYALFYEQRGAGLGRRFIDEVVLGIEILLSQPQIGQQIDDIFRSFVLGDFPFSLIYSIEPEKIWIVAVAHQYRRPDYWRKRRNP